LIIIFSIRYILLFIAMVCPFNLSICGLECNFFSVYVHLKVHKVASIISLVYMSFLSPVWLEKVPKSVYQSRHILTAFVWSFLWPSFVMAVLVIQFIWLYTLVFVYSGLGLLCLYNGFYVFFVLYVKFVSFVFIGSSRILGLCKV
jgi:hypothetical protein